MNDVICPYCNTEQNIDHDKGKGYDETHREEQECNKCYKKFVFDTWSTFYYTAYKADCLNGSDHNFEFSRLSPDEYAQMRCVDCEYSRKATTEEIQKRSKS